jgi:hypothetical protein
MKRIERPLPLFLLLIALPLLACGTLLPEPAAGIPPPPTLFINTPAAVAAENESLAPTVTPFGEIPPAEATAEAVSGPLVRALVDVNVRTGPGVQYDRDGHLLARESAVILGRDPASGWWKIRCPARSEGTECWVTGGSSYTSAADAGDIPVAQAPATPTPSPSATAAPVGEAGVLPSPSPAASATSVAVAVTPASGRPVTRSPLIAFVDDGDLFAAPLLPSDAGAALGQITQLTSSGAVQALYVSPTGDSIAYLETREDGNALIVVSLDGETVMPLVESRDLPQLPGLGSSSLSRMIDRVQWLADGQSLIFSTHIPPMEPGIGPALDLWTMQLGGQPVENFPSGTAGGWFSASPTDELIMSWPTEIVRVNLDGSNRQQVATFAAVNTASEYAYFPEAQWLSDGETARVAVPEPEPFAEDAAAELLELPAGALPAASIGNVAGNILFNPVYWTATGERLAYIRQIVSDPALTLVIAAGDGADPQEYTQEQTLQFLGWNPLGSRFLYGGVGYYAVGDPEAAPVVTALPAGNVPVAAEWFAEDRFVVAFGALESWRLAAGNQAGAFIPLLDIHSPLPLFEVWYP